MNLNWVWFKMKIDWDSKLQITFSEWKKIKKMSITNFHYKNEYVIQVIGLMNIRCKVESFLFKSIRNV